MHEEERLQEYSEDRDKMKQPSNKKLLNTPATNKSQQLSPQKHVIQQVLTQQIPIQLYNDELKMHLQFLIANKQETFFKFIRSLENVKLDKQQEEYKNGLVDYLNLLYNPKNKPETQYQGQVVSKASNELIIIAKKLINSISLSLSQEDRQKYAKSVTFYQQIASKIGKIYNENDKNFLSIYGLLRLDFMMLFFLKNKDYEQMFDIKHIITQHYFLSIFDIPDYEYAKFKQRFEENINILQPVHQQKFNHFMNLICILQLRQKIYKNNRNKSRKAHQERRIFNNLQKKTTKKYQPFGNLIKFQFSEVALLNKCTKHAKIKAKTKQNAVEKLILSLIKQPDANLKQQLITVKEETTTSLVSLVQLYNQILSNSNEKANNYDVGQERQKQIDACSWIYLNYAVARKNQSFDTNFYRLGKPISKFNLTFNLILKKALQRYQLFAGASITLLNILHQFPQPPMVYICRFEYSYNEIKGTSFPLKKQKSSEKTEEDLKCTLIIGICQNKILFSALRNSRITDTEFKKFLGQYFSNFHKDKRYNIALYEFEHNRRTNWDDLGKIIFQLKSKFGFNVFILNYPPAFLQHLSINACLRYLLKENSDQITRENFNSKVHTFQRDVVKTFRSAEAGQILLKFLQFTKFTRKT